MSLLYLRYYRYKLHSRNLQDLRVLSLTRTRYESFEPQIDYSTSYYWGIHFNPFVDSRNRRNNGASTHSPELGIL